MAAERAKEEEAKTDIDDKPSLLSVIAVSVAGSALEWYDFAVFGFLAKEIGQNFFPNKKDPKIAIIEAFGLYAGGFLVRPLGSLLFGAIGDKWGSAMALQISIIAMAVPTTLMGVLPTYQKIGIAAPAILTVLRLLQGVMVGGEIIGAVMYTVDNTDPSQRCMFGGLVLGMALLGIFLGSAVATTMHHYMTKAEIVRYGWRIPFLCGLAVASVGFFVRQSKAAKRGHRAYSNAKPGQSAVDVIIQVFKGHWKEVIEGAGVASLYHAGFYISCVWNGTYLASLAPQTVRADVAFGINSVGLALHIALLPVFGACADKYGRALVMGIGALITAVVAPPCFLLLARGPISQRFLGTVIFTSAVSCYGGPLFGWLINNSSALARYTAVGLAYNLAAAAFGGSAPLIASLLTRTDSVVAPGAYVSAVAALSFVVVIFSHYFIGERHHKREQAKEIELGSVDSASEVDLRL